MRKPKLRLVDLFAGIGGARIGFEAAGFETVYANDCDPKVAEAYRLNFGEVDGEELFSVIRNGGMKRVPKRFDVLAAGFPCQPFSVAGRRRGFSDEGRGDLLFGVVEILKARKPEAVLLENVKHLKNHNDEKTFQRIQGELKGAGYAMKAEVLNSLHYGNVPQARERIYIVAFRSPRTLMKFHFPERIPLLRTMPQILEKHVPEKYYYTEEDRYIYPKLKAAVRRKDRFYQYRRTYVRENKSGACPTLMANMGAGGHNVPIVRDAQGIRRLTPRECARLQGFPESFAFPAGQADSHLYRQIGNSMTVPLIVRLAENIRIALES
ncbi:MAG: DNA (cytosine-5-)-methyltransferase [Candidatus Omnitrophica bacterium]|nr:DNA (cytosine-5-)-methyltransferase [Candidatus Omnitrophota bacterium]